MLTGRRIRERQAAERAGQPPPAPPRPAEISRRQHDAEIAELKNAHARELAALRAQDGSEELDQLRKVLEALPGQIDEALKADEGNDAWFDPVRTVFARVSALRSDLEQTKAALAKAEADLAELLEKPSAEADKAEQAPPPAPEAPEPAPDPKKRGKRS